MPTKMIEIKNLQKKFKNNIVLKDISEHVDKGQVICVIGPSGAGKSTFLRCLNALEQPTSGQVLFEGQNLIGLSDKKLDQLREKMGMVFQSFNLFINRWQVFKEYTSLVNCHLKHIIDRLTFISYL